MGSGRVEEVYLDNNATTRPLESVRKAMWEAQGEEFGNPSSVHAGGERARRQLRTSRQCVADLLGCEADRIIFTSGATEANNQVLQAILGRPRKSASHVVTSCIEHSSILKTCSFLQSQGVEVTYLKPDREGQISPDDMARAIGPRTVLVSLQWVNNETGAVLPVERFGAICRAKGIPFHTDAAQAVGKVPMALGDLPVDALSFTSHKFHGPQGMGGLYLHRDDLLMPLLYGGGQEGGRRSGTEYVPGIVGTGVAALARKGGLAQALKTMGDLRDYFEDSIKKSLPDVRVNGDVQHRVCNTSNLLFQGVDGQALVVRLDQSGIRCSQSSACTSQRPEPSYVLRAMGLTEEEAYSSVRFGFSEFNTRTDVDRAVQAVVDICRKLRAFSAMQG